MPEVCVLHDRDILIYALKPAENEMKLIQSSEVAFTWLSLPWLQKFR